jgi:hypothetical protein
MKQAGGRTGATGGGVNSAEMFRVPVRSVDNLSERVTSVYESIGRMIQRRIVIEPNTTIRQWGHGFHVEVDFPNTDPARIRLYMSATALLVLAPIQGKWHQLVAVSLHLLRDADLRHRCLGKF